MSFELDFTTPSPPQDGGPARDVYTPSRLNREARILLERGLPALWVEGEISNLSRPASGHWYFSLKDAAAQLRCAMFRQKNLFIRFAPKDGMHVQIRGRVSLYEPRGDYQFLVDHIEEAGEGALRRRFELLKTQLAAEGLFAQERKRPLPTLPRRIGVITSPTGAAVRDILHQLQRRFCTIPVLIYPVPVQGATAAPQIAAAIRCAAARAECDVLILARGGGSLEDLWAFNEEVVARAIFDCTIPIVSGVGHEVDFTIADLVADVRAPTPSAAAERVTTPDSHEWMRIFGQHARHLHTTLRRHLSRHADRIGWLERRLDQVHPGAELRRRSNRLNELTQRLGRCLSHALYRKHSDVSQLAARLRHGSPEMHITTVKHRVDVLEARLQRTLHRQVDQLQARFEKATGRLSAVSPLATLQRGYAIVTTVTDRVVTDASALAQGELIKARLAKGTLIARIEGLLEATGDSTGDFK
jgi:exodeoxyribonuclease VII large subunit